jgi:L-alanine-DL-glutamate epimerase-like enolase superfamily enzyme
VHFRTSLSVLLCSWPQPVIPHLTAAALINSVWDLYARVEAKPLWKLLADFEPEQVGGAIDFAYITDAITPDEALALLKERGTGKETRLQQSKQHGYPAYTTSVGWFGFADDKIRQLCREALNQGWTHFKLKVGGDPGLTKSDVARRFGRTVSEIFRMDQKPFFFRNPDLHTLPDVKITYVRTAYKPQLAGTEEISSAQN